MGWTTSEAKTESEWFDDYVKLALATPAPGLPLTSQRIGSSDATWFEIEPGVAFIATTGGSPDDRVLAEFLLREQLRVSGIEQAQWYIEPDFNERTADWSDIEAKAKRLRDAGSVQLLRNGYTNVVGQVQGDHGNYQTEIMRQDPNSRVITQWSCECPWDQYAFQRTRQWKKYEGRPCAHVLATFWKSQATPLDEDVHPSNPQNPQGQLPGMPAPGQPQPPSLFNTPGQMQPGGAPSFGQPMQPQGEQMQLPGMQPGMATGTPPQPSGVIPMGPGIIPEPPMTGPMANPASVPGLRQPSPTNPVQYPGGTFSKALTDDWDFDRLGGVAIAAQPTGFINGNMVSTRHDDWGTWVGRSELHGAGTPAKIPRGSVGEVLGTDPTGMVEVLFMNPAISVNEHGRMEPWGATAFFFPSEIVERPDIKRPGPAIKRR